MLFSRNPLNSDEEAIKVENPTWKTHVAYISALLASGFRRIPDNRTDYYKFLPCPLGTFANFSSRGTEGCIECPPGKLLNYLLQVSVALSVAK